MASARFRIGTAATNSAGTSWSWRGYDTSADIASGSYVKVELESTTGVRSLAVSIPSADEVTLAAGVPSVTTVQASKTATFRAGTAAARTYLIRAQINGGKDINNDTVADYTKQLAAHIKCPNGTRLLAVGETDEYNRTYGYTGKMNAAIRLAGTSALASSGVVAGTYALATVTVSSTGVITSAATGSVGGLASSGVVAGTYSLATVTVSSTGVITSAATGSATLGSSGVTAGTYTYATVTISTAGIITNAANGTTPAPANAQYLTIGANNATLSAERQLKAVAPLSLTDYGANSSAAIAHGNSGVASGSYAGVFKVNVKGHITSAAAVGKQTVEYFGSSASGNYDTLQNLLSALETLGLINATAAVT